MLIGISVAGEKHIAVIVPHLHTKNMTSRTNRMVLESNHTRNHAAIYIYMYKTNVRNNYAQQYSNKQR